MIRKIIFTNQYKKDLKLARRRLFPEEELNDVIFKLASDIPLSADKKDHNLKEDYIGYRECHIKLIYSKTDNNELHILELVRTGTHSDLF